MAAIPSVFLGLGSNVGDREANLLAARRGLEARGFRVTALSSLYLTEPVDAPPQDWFLNAVAGGETALSPEALLQACLDTERALGRVRDVPRGPRTIDLDLLLHGSEVREGPGLVLPHPRMPERRFVLVPLVEIAPGARHPVLGLTAAEMLGRCPDRSQVVLHERSATR
jgi:2-amino-4-hydroxy-6-hydroxymethyldihydropteridine diphosphokinase